MKLCADPFATLKFTGNTEHIYNKYYNNDNTTHILYLSIY